MTETNQALYDAILQQRKATVPAAHVWVGASAGSGKTRVLVDRVLRLLLGDEEAAPAAPHKILCLTFTKAAAAEMGARVQSELSHWVTTSNDTLILALTDLTGSHPSPKLQRRARELFAHVSDAPGGLRIQTIHSFCQSTLARFPIEAGIAPNFIALDEREAALLLQQALAAALYQPKIVSSAARHYFLTSFSEDIIITRLGTMRRDWAKLDDAMQAAGGFTNYRQQIYDTLQVQDDNLDAFWQRQLSDIQLAAAHVPEIVAALSHGAPTNQNAAVTLEEFLALPPTARYAQHDQYVRVFLTSSYDLRKKPLSKGALKHNAAAEDWFYNEAVRLQQALNSVKNIRCAFATSAWLELLAQVMQNYAALKQRRNALDFDDMIDYTRDLLSDEQRAQWVMYKLDEGIDHILVDEAQDTSAAQWDIVKYLSQEFFVGQSAQDKTRTLFVVGDEKQSIFAFQGADAAGFDRMRQYFDLRASQAATHLERVPLYTSFRSAPAILDVVDRVFDNAELRGSIQADALANLKHRARRSGAGGSVTLWPLVVKQAATPDMPETIPESVQSADDPAARFAKKLAVTIAHWLKTQRRLTALNRPVTAGDIMILVRRRDPAFITPLVKELKARDIPVAGLDRLKLTAHIAVEDMLRLLEFLLLPEDDLALANILKSPLVNWDDAQLFDIAHTRQGTLWHALPPSNIKSWLSDLLARVDYVAPYDLLADVLNQPCPANAVSGLQAMVARLGHDAVDPLTELLNQAADFGRRLTGTTQEFIDWLLRNAPVVKREAGEHAAEVRILTIHGAKGLEAPVVIMADTVGLPDANNEALPRWLLPDEDLPVPLWAARRDDEPELFQRHQQKRICALYAEYQRLLYVALTRARDELYIGGYNKDDKVSEQSWYHSVKTALESFEHTAQADGRLIYAIEPRDIEKASAPVTTVMPKLEMPDWLYTAAPLEQAIISRSVTESTVDLTNTIVSVPQEQGIQRGIIIHRLLQSLPDLPGNERQAAALRYLAHAAPQALPAVHEQIWREVDTLLHYDGFAPLFTLQARAEVPIIGRVNGAIVTGRIDRLLITPQEILIVDYKTNAQPPDNVPAAYRAQLMAYGRLLTRQYPAHRLRMAILWTALPRLDEIALAADLRAASA